MKRWTVASMALMAGVAMADVGIKEPDAQIDRVSDEQLVALALVVVQSGYRCDTVSAASRSPFDGSFRVHCNNYRYGYDVEDVGGRWTARVRR